METTKVDHYDDYDGHLTRSEIHVTRDTVVLNHNGHAIEGDTFIEIPDATAVTKELADAVWDVLGVDLTHHDVEVVEER